MIRNLASRGLLRPRRRCSYRFATVVAWLSSSTTTNQLAIRRRTSLQHRCFAITKANPPSKLRTGTSSTIMAAAAPTHTSASAAGGDKKEAHNNPQNSDSTTSSTSPSSCLKLHYLEQTTSTQDEARRWLSENRQQLLETATCDAATTSHDEAEEYQSTSSSPSSCCLAVMARQQSQGRGTSGRTWLSQRGNLFLTVAIPQTDVPIPLTLLPLQVGVIVARRLDSHLRRRLLLSSSSDSSSSMAAPVPEFPRVTVKWPNDVLINQEKIAGVLIENHYVPADSSSSNSAASWSYWFLVGIGVNVRHAPSVPTNGPQRGRPSTSLYHHLTKSQLVNGDHNNNADSDEDNDQHDNDVDDDLARILGQEIAQDLVNWIYQDANENTKTSKEYTSPQAMLQQRKQKRAQQVVDDWKQWAGLLSRNTNSNIQYTLRETGEVVQVVDLEPDGQLRVWHAASRQERVLAADYLY